MRTVWKATLKIDDDVQPVVMPEGAIVRHVDCQGVRTLQIWFECDPSKSSTNRNFRVHGTGHENIEKDEQWVGTALSGPFVWHVYEVK